MQKHLLTAIVLGVMLSSSATAQDLERKLHEADRLAWLTNWYDALPIYAEVEQAATKAGNRRDAMYAKFGRLRGQMQTLPLPDISEQIAADLESPLAKRDPEAEAPRTHRQGRHRSRVGRPRRRARLAEPFGSLRGAGRQGLGESRERRAGNRRVPQRQHRRGHDTRTTGVPGRREVRRCRRSAPVHGNHCQRAAARRIRASRDGIRGQSAEVRERASGDRVPVRGVQHEGAHASRAEAARRSGAIREDCDGGGTGRRSPNQGNRAVDDARADCREARSARASDRASGTGCCHGQGGPGSAATRRGRVRPRGCAPRSGRSEPSAPLRLGGRSRHDGRRQPLHAAGALEGSRRDSRRARTSGRCESRLRSSRRHRRRHHGQRPQPRGAGSPRWRDESNCTPDTSGWSRSV